MNLRRLVAVSACAATLSVANLASAQQAQPPAQPRQSQPQPQRVQKVQGQPGAGQVVQQTQWKNVDHQLATCIAIDNQAEIAIAKMAQEKAKNNDVKEFAAMLVKDHQGFLGKLQQFAPEATQEGFLNDNEREPTVRDNQGTSSTQPRGTSTQAKVQPAGGQVQVAANPIQQTAASDQNQSGQLLDPVQLHREIAEQCIHSAKHGMSKKDGTQFDECFVGMQIAAHAEMKNKLVVFERHATGDLKQLIASGIETTEKHMKRAEDLMKSLADSDSSVSKRDRNDSKK